MTKVIGPCFGLDARGTLKGGITYSIRKGVNYVRGYVEPKNPKTAAQNENRGAFADGVSKWRFCPDLIADADKVLWVYYAVGTTESGYNRFLRYYLKSNYDSATQQKITPQVIPFPQ